MAGDIKSRFKNLNKKILAYMNLKPQALSDLEL